MWPFKKKNVATAPKQFLTSRQYAVPFLDDLSEPAILKNHAVRALCGAFMDRHSKCLSPHPFCGDINSHPVILIANAIRQISPDGPVLAIYLSRATDEFIARPGTGTIDPLEGAVSFRYLDEAPYRKMVVNLANDGTYLAYYGSILNPVDGDYSTGGIDPSTARLLHCNPEPQHTEWQYWESRIPVDEFVPRYHCLVVHGQCWVVEVNPSQNIYQQVAGLSISDNPNHNYGIYQMNPGDILAIDPTDDSEYAKVIRENCPVELWLPR